MSAIELTEGFLAKAAGWEAVKQARGLIAADRVLSSDWQPPMLRGVVQEGSISYRAGLVIKDAIDLENLCQCRASKRWGTICAHSVAVGLHWLKTKQASQAPDLDWQKEEGEGQGAGEQKGEPRPATSIEHQKSKSDIRASEKKQVNERRLSRADPGKGGESMEMFVILPPNLSQAVHRGKLMVFLEGQWSGGRAPLDRLPRTVSFELSALDSALLDHLERLSGGDTPSMMQLSMDQWVDLLPLLVNHPRVTLGKSQAITVADTPCRIGIQAALEDSGEIRLALQPGGSWTPICGRETAWAICGNTIQPLGLSKAYWEILRGPLELPRSRVPQFLGQEWPAWLAAGDIEANFCLDDFTLEPRVPRFQLELAGGWAQLEARLQCSYGARLVPLGSPVETETFWMPDPDRPTCYSARDLAAERAALARLVRSGFTGPDAQGRWKLQGQNSVLNFFALEYPALKSEWEVTLEERLARSTRQNLERIEPQFQITSSGIDWFDLSVSFQSSGGEPFSAAEIQRLLLAGQGYTRLRNGRIALLDTGAVEDLGEVLRDCAPEQQSGVYRLDHAQAGFIGATLDRHRGWQIQAPSDWRQWARQQSGEAAPPCPPLGELESVLRPYQKAGVAWFHFLRTNGFGGILADEMGLGKTAQALAFLQATRRESPSLIVCPTSLVFNWVAEAKKFTPRLKVIALDGPQRHTLWPRVPQSDLVVTSYALLRRDLERYRDYEFDTVILDEAQHIKNRQTQSAQAVKAVRARHRFVLTGTPLENSVLDLWSIFDFLMPGYLGAARDFRERYEIPIMRDKNAAAQDRLARRIKPFLLRRLKREVATDLPPRLEQVAYCELTDAQQAVYRQILDESRRAVTEAVDARGLPRSRMLVFTALLRLRQVCCDLRLLNLPAIDPVTTSAKLDLMGELLEEILDGGHRALVFSQFVGMLSLLREKLDAEKVEYCYLDGSTVDRESVVNRFQRQDQIPVFLISLKTGGLGLNLTGADTVVHYDPWWNPAVMDQASDRAHRIGQKRVVTTYKLITRGTVEEKILELQNRKRELLQATMGGDEQWVSRLSWDEIQELLA
ncbi:MAG: SNF2 family helicase [Candidatus Omnitrophica bacterium]|nr:SNF2 family helicase [Candidatus Omnitrophota bacterium]